MTVSGMTIVRTERHPDHNRDNQTQRHRSPGLRTGRLVWIMLHTALRFMKFVEKGPAGRQLL